MIPTQEAIEYTSRAIQINNSGNKNCSRYFAINSYVNLAIFYKTIKLYKSAYSYYDSAIINNDDKKLFNPIAQECYMGKVLLSLRLGDYQKCIEDCTRGIAIAARSNRMDLVMQFYNQRAQSNLYLKKINDAFADVDSAKKYALMLKDNFELASEAKTRALLQGERLQYNEAIAFFAKCIQYRTSTGDFQQIADDFTDLGNFYLKRKDYAKAIDNYKKTLLYAKRAEDAERLCKGYANLGEVFFLQGSITGYKRSVEYYQQALGIFGIHETSIQKNPTLQKLSSIGNTDLLFVILGNKTKLLLQLFKSTNKTEYLDACIGTGMLMDSAITEARREQTGENSKLYWRNETRRFFENILEACYLAGDVSHAFYFMEKSRAVLLNDKLNESAASIRLPEAENLKEQAFKLRLVEAKMQMNIHDADYDKNHLKFLEIKDEFERFVKTLEQKYPAYYKYKYDDDTPTLNVLQERLAQNKETFIHYFIEDTVLYILIVNENNAKIFKPDHQQFRTSDLKLLMNYCSNKQRLNNDYDGFAALSYKLYNILFAILNVAPGHIIISQDNSLIPFEVLSKRQNGRQFLLYDYTFSYVYSASFLLKKMSNRNARANFIGFAPVSFKRNLNIPDLKNAAIALQKSADHYNNMLLLESNKATRNSFLSKISDYNIVSVFSHALADTVNNEPVLYMQDSVINLSELQLLNHPATQLVILSACQTNVGRNETGEGIYSLARGFASAGIPAVSATLWKADENAIYQISDKFNKFLSDGFRKDEALQKAKLNFMEGNSDEKLLPYYWANMVLIGKSDPVSLLPKNSISANIWWVICCMGIVSSVLVIKYYRKKNKYQV
ncbi:MAG: CHAT domain-containing protein [Agriterribacter sp.]